MGNQHPRHLILLLSALLLLLACGPGTAAPGKGDAPAAAPAAPTAAPAPPAPKPAAPTAAPKSAPVPPSGPGNLFPNPSFEEGRSPWYAILEPAKPYWADFEVSAAKAHTGRYSARLPLRSEGYTGKVRIYGAVQEVSPKEMPRRIGGWYRVEGWKRGATNQYLQAVVIVWQPANVAAFKDSNVQVSFVLGGITAPPFQIANRKFHFTGPLEPRQGEWVPFEFDLHEAFLKDWGVVPAGFQKLRILFEVRFDGRDAAGPPASADVYYDDLYVGP